MYEQRSGRRGLPRAKYVIQGLFYRCLLISQLLQWCQEAKEHSQRVMKTGRQSLEFRDHREEGLWLVSGFVLVSTKLQTSSKGPHWISHSSQSLKLSWESFSALIGLSWSGIPRTPGGRQYHIKLQITYTTFHIKYWVLSKNNQSFEMARIYDANTRETIDKETYAWEAISWV